MMIVMYVMIIVMLWGYDNGECYDDDSDAMIIMVSCINWCVFASMIMIDDGSNWCVISFIDISLVMNVMMIVMLW